MPSLHPRSCSGQASVDYVALVALVALVLAGAAAARGALPDVAGAVARYARVALCVVGGDVCRSVDAAAAGLEPCVRRADSRDRRGALTLLWMRRGDDSGYVVERRSDGTIALTATRGRDLAASMSVGVRLVRGRAGGDATLGLRWREGRTFELADEAALRRFLRRHPAPAELASETNARLFGAPAPAYVYREGGTIAEAGASAEALGVSLDLVGVSDDRVLGRRIGRGETTHYIDAKGFGPRLLGRGDGRPRAWVLEVTERGGRRVGALLRSTSTRAGRLTEELAQLDPRTLRRTGAVERRVYRVSELESGPDIGFNLGAAGFEHSTAAQRRTLVSATLHEPDGTAVRRIDCTSAGM